MYLFRVRQSFSMKSRLRFAIWIAVALIGMLALATIALHRGEQINALWLVTAAVCTYALGYRFYSKFIAAKVLMLDGQRATPAERLENGRDFLPTNKWVVFGHHFAAIAGPGPLIGPTLAAQFGYLPGTLWILVGAVFGGSAAAFRISSSCCSPFDATGNRSPRWLRRRSGGSADS